MIKLIFKVLIFVFFPGVVLSQTGSITNIQVAQRTDGTGNVDIYYDLAGPGSIYFISMEVRFNNGSTFTAVSSSYLTGNNCVTPGSNRHLIWNGQGSNNNTYSTQTKIKLIANTYTECGQPIIINHLAGAIAPVNKTVTYGTATNIPGEPTKCWITSNLGSDHQATAVNDATEASAGWYWQFNRKQGYKHDGTNRTPNNPWITYINENSDWLIANDPCSAEIGDGWRIPTYSEWYNVDNFGNWNNWNEVWNSNLKLHGAGFLDFTNGYMYDRGTNGSYMSSTQDNTFLGLELFFTNNQSNVVPGNKVSGVSLRCLKEIGNSTGQPCPGIPTVAYGGQTYNTIQIGTQCWLKENLNIGTKINGTTEQTNNSIIEKYCYNNDEANCAISGGLYQWNEMMQYVTTPGVKGICPAGWHIPTDGEWCTVTQFLDPTVNCGTSSWSGTNAGGKMKSTGTLETGTGLWLSPNTGATNESEFTAVPAGKRISYGSFNFIGYYGAWWSSSESSTNNAWCLDLYFGFSTVLSYYDPKFYGFSVRCVRDF